MQLYQTDVLHQLQNNVPFEFEFSTLSTNLYVHNVHNSTLVATTRPADDTPTAFTFEFKLCTFYTNFYVFSLYHYKVLFDQSLTTKIFASKILTPCYFRTIRPSTLLSNFNKTRLIKQSKIMLKNSLQSNENKV